MQHDVVARIQGCQVHKVFNAIINKILTCISHVHKGNFAIVVVIPVVEIPMPSIHHSLSFIRVQIELVADKFLHQKIEALIENVLLSSRKRILAMCTKLLHPHKMWCAKFCTPIYTCAQNICHAPKNDEDHERLEGFDKSLLLRKLWAPATYCAKTQSSHAIRQNMCSTSTMVNRALLMLKLTFLSGKNVKWSCLPVRQRLE